MPRSPVKISQDILESCYKSGIGHIASSFSCLDILYVLYKSFLLEKNHDFILSKGHAAPALYAILKHFSLVGEAEYSNFGRFGSRLISHPTCRIPAIQYATGALGLGLSVGIGMSMANILDNRNARKVFILMGDGELNEGSVWEALTYASSNNLTNLIVLVDSNGLQASDYTKNIIDSGPLEAAIAALGWKTQNVDGHNITVLEAVLQKAIGKIGPHIFFCRTVKGKGVSFMENTPEWHHKKLTDNDYRKALKELMNAKQ